MSQHDFTIGNQLFPATRTDLNNALVALASNSSGTTAPSTTYANQWWYETDTNTLKIRNEADSAWIEIAVLDQSANNVLSITTQGLTLAGTPVTATGADLNKLSGVTASAAELNKLDGITRGSIMYGSAAGTALLPKGTTGQVLSATATDITWVSSSPAITSDGASPSLSANITGAEIRTLIGAGETYTHPNHTGEVTSSGDGATVVANNVIDEANLKVSNTPTNGYVLTAQSGNTGGLTWAAVTSGGGGYADSDVDTHLNTSTATSSQVLSWTGSDYDWVTQSGGSGYTHPNHTGEVVSSGDGSTIIVNNMVDEANLKVSNNPTDGYVLTAQSGNTGGLTWAAGGGDLVADTTPQLGGNLDGNGKNILLGFDPNPDFDIDASGSTASADALDYLKIAQGIDNNEFDGLLGVEAPWTDTTIKHHYKIIKGSSTGALREGSSLSSDFGDLVVFGNVHSDGTNSNITTGMTIDGGNLRLIAQGEADHSTTGYASLTIDAADVAVTGTVDGRDIATNIPASLGSAGQVLTVNSGATAAEWAAAVGATGYGHVGTYAYLTRPDGNSVAVGSSHSGSGLRFSSVASTNDWNYNTSNSVTTTAATGTWTAMGGSGAAAGTSHTIGTVFLRIS